MCAYVCQDMNKTTYRTITYNSINWKEPKCLSRVHEKWIVVYSSMCFHNANELQLQQHRLSSEKILVKETRNKITYAIWVHVHKIWKKIVLDSR